MMKSSYFKMTKTDINGEGVLKLLQNRRLNCSSVNNNIKKVIVCAKE